MSTQQPWGSVSEGTVSGIVELAWADEVPFDAIAHQFGLREADVIALMRRQLKPSSFRLWRERVTGRRSKHRARMG